MTSNVEENLLELECFQCQSICLNPRYLHCFHSICSNCLNEFNENPLKIFCSKCQIETKVEYRMELKSNEILRNRIEKYQMNSGEIRCNSCSSNDRSISHCSTCSSYLCFQCCQAHSMMKCFEHHQVRSILSSSSLQDNEDEDEDEGEEKKKKKSNQFIVEQRNLIEQLEKHLENLREEQNKENLHQFEQIENDFREQRNVYIEYLNNYFNQCENQLKEFRNRKEKDFQEKCLEVENGEKIFRRLKFHFDSMEKLGFSSEEYLSFHQNYFYPQIEFLKRFFDEFYFQIKQMNKIDFQIKFYPLNLFHQWIQNNLIEFNSTTNCLQSDDKSNESNSNENRREKSPEIHREKDGGEGGQQQEKEEEKEEEEEEEVVSPRENVNSLHCEHFQPVEENLRALESIFVHQLSEVNQHLFSPNEIPANHYSMLTRQTSAPPLGQQRSPTSNYFGYAPPSLLGTYSTTNSGGSSNGNNSRSDTPYSSTLNPSSTSLDLLSQSQSQSQSQLQCSQQHQHQHLSQSNSTRRTGQTMQIRTKFGSLGPQKCQFNAPHGFCLGLDEEIIVADTNNHRIQIFDKTGEYKYQFGIPGKEEGQLWYPRKVSVIRQTGKLVVCDRGNERSRMQIFTRNGIFIKKISIRYIDIVAGLAITQQGNIVAVDSVSPTVFCISENGDLLKWFDCSDYMREPSDLAIFNQEYFVCDFKGHCVVVFDEEGNFLRRIGSESITNFPNGIDISDQGDVIIGDSHGNRFHIAVYNRQGDFLQEFDCPYVKVSRCCGLKITSDGFIVTLAKNNHHVLVLNTLYLT